MSEKVYYNEKLEKMLNRYIKEEKYGGFKPLLHEIFQRRAYEFQFDEGQMRKQIKNFVKRTEKIGFGKNIPKITNSYAVNHPFEGKDYIWFNCQSNMFDIENEYVGSKNWMVDVYETLAHEVYHGISKHTDGTRIKNLFQRRGTK